MQIQGKFLSYTDLKNIASAYEKRPFISFPIDTKGNVGLSASLPRKRKRKKERRKGCHSDVRSKITVSSAAGPRDGGGNAAGARYSLRSVPPRLHPTPLPSLSYSPLPSPHPSFPHFPTPPPPRPPTPPSLTLHSPSLPSPILPPLPLTLLSNSLFSSEGVKLTREGLFFTSVCVNYSVM